jgi:probable rRNA maturation factor
MNSALNIEVVNLTRLAIDPAVVTRLLSGVLESEGVTAGELGVRFVGARRMRELNREYLGHDEVTDVLAFPLEDDEASGAPVFAVEDDDLHEPGPGPDGPDPHEPDVDEPGSDPGDAGDAAVPDMPRLLGDVVVCSRRAATQALAAGTPLAFEIAMLLVHGTLHVLGYDHERDAGEMALRQARHLDDASWEHLLGKT